LVAVVMVFTKEARRLPALPALVKRFLHEPGGLPQGTGRTLPEEPV